MLESWIVGLNQLLEGWVGSWSTQLLDGWGWELPNSTVERVGLNCWATFCWATVGFNSNFSFSSLFFLCLIFFLFFPFFWFAFPFFACPFLLCPRFPFSFSCAFICLLFSLFLAFSLSLFFQPFYSLLCLFWFGLGLPSGSETCRRKVVANGSMTRSPAPLQKTQRPKRKEAGCGC